MDLRATQRNAAADAWDFLTRTPTAQDGVRCCPPADVLATVTINGTTRRRWQYKPTVRGSARIWYAVDTDKKGGGTVFLERVDTAHPNETK
jgi:hypothetical protein